MSRSAQVIQNWLVDRVSRRLGQLPETIDVQAPFEHFGLDSVMVVTLIADLETWMGWRFHENPLEDHPTLAALAQYLAECDEKKNPRT